MMNSINKIHFNSSTGVSLNDRFTVISRISPSEKTAGGGHERNGSGGILRKRSNSVDSYASRGSYANRQLVNQLDRRHIGQSQTALRLRNKTIRSGRQRLNRTSLATRPQLRRAVGNTLSLSGGSRRLQRSNSYTDVASMNADFVERQALRRSNSQLSIASRLGSGGRSRGGPRRPMQRTNSSTNLAGRGRSQSRGRSRSRSRSRTRLPRSRSRGNLTRNRSRSTGLNGIGYNNNNNNNNHIESRLGRGGRMRGRTNIRRGRGGGPARLARSASRTNLRDGSVNGRLSGNRNNRLLGTRGGRGRVAKRGQRRGPAGFGQNGTGGGRPGRTLQRRGGARGGGALPTGGARRGRSRSRGRAISQNRGRSAQRGRNASRGRRASAPSMSKEQLDNELDQYMANTKSSLDKEMDEYMNGINNSI